MCLKGVRVRLILAENGDGCVLGVGQGDEGLWESAGQGLGNTHVAGALWRWSLPDAMLCNQCSRKGPGVIGVPRWRSNEAALLPDFPCSPSPYRYLQAEGSQLSE
jgi:hypothetical protein